MDSGRNGGGDNAHADSQPDSHPEGTDGAVSLDQWSTSRLLSTAARLWEREVAKDLHAAKLSPSGLTALQALAEIGTTNKARLARHIHITAQSLRRTLNNLEDIGYIRKSLRTIGQRGINISLTPDGARALTAVQGDIPEGEGADPTAVEPRRSLPITALRKDLVELLQRMTPAPENTDRNIRTSSNSEPSFLASAGIPVIPKTR